MLEFNAAVATPLCEIMGRYGSDKGNLDNSQQHNYTTFYHYLFKNLKPSRVFELGIGTNDVTMASNMGANGRPGASLYCWREFFPNALVYGADIDRKCLFATDRIQTFYCDQTDQTSIQQLWAHPELSEKFDIIIEDGLHHLHANVCFFENSIHKLARGGYYIIEDIREHDTLPAIANKIGEWVRQYPHLSFQLMKIPHRKNNFGNNLVVVHYP